MSVRTPSSLFLLFNLIFLFTKREEENISLNDYLQIVNRDPINSTRPQEVNGFADYLNMQTSTNATASATMLPPNRIPIPQNAFRPITNEMPSTLNSVPSTIGQAQGTMPKSTATTVVNATTSSINSLPVRPTIEPKVAKSIGRTNSIRNKTKPTTGIQLPRLAGTSATNNIFNSNLPMVPKFPPFGQLSQANVQQSMISPFINSVISNDQQYNDTFVPFFTQLQQLSQSIQVNNLLKIQRNF